MFLRELFSENEDFVRETKIVMREKNTVKSETSSKESDNTSIAGPTTWIKEDKMLNVGPFTGNPGVKQILSDPTKV
jgi:hypothetical protein